MTGGTYLLDVKYESRISERSVLDEKIWEKGNKVMGDGV